MTELKTLKDLRRYKYRDDAIRRVKTGHRKHNVKKVIDEKELKAEAVKWVKFHRSKPILNACAVEDWIINFFNLTEEDLK